MANWGLNVVKQYQRLVVFTFGSYTGTRGPGLRWLWPLVDGGTGMYTGIGSGTGETRNWVAAAGAAAGKPGVVVDYVPVYASPCGMGFAYWEM